MWQLLVAAAVAGSGFLARRLLIFGNNGDPSKDHHIFEHKKEEVEEQREQVQEEEKEDIGEVVKPSSFPIFGGSVERCHFGRSEGQVSVVEEEGIFRFCSLSGGGFRSKSKRGLSGKKVGDKRTVEVQKDGNKLGLENADEMTMGFSNPKKKKKNKKGRKLPVCLKKRRTGKNVCGNFESCCSEGSSHLSWGIGVGLMCMISAGRAEINKLNVAIDEAKEVVNDLKYKLYKGKLSLQDSSFENGCSKGTMGVHRQLEIILPDPKVASLSDNNVSGDQFIDDCEYASSVLTDEPEPQLLEIDQLEAELAFELEKISCDAPEEAYNLRANLDEVDKHYFADVKNDGLSGGPLVTHENIRKDCNFYQSHGVSPYELDRKLCHLLIKQQESQIVDLQSKLQSTRIKLRDREAELVSLKNCVRHFSDLSLEANTDEETMDANEPDKNSDLPATCRMLFDSGSSGTASGQRVVVGVKRLMEIEHVTMM